MVQKNDLYDYENQYIYQDDRYFKFSLDSILLAEYAINISDDSKVLEMCCGNMAISLVLTNYTKAKIVGFEITKEIATLAEKSILINNKDNQIKVINDDINNISKYYNCEEFDYIICNPPYFKVSSDKNLNDRYEKRIARHEVKLNLEQIFEISFKFLKNNGILYLVHRTERLDDIINLATKYNVRVKNIQLISTKENKQPTLVLIKCVKNAKSGVKVSSELCIENMSSFKNIFRR